MIKRKISDLITPKFRKSPLLSIHEIEKARDDGSELKHLIHQTWRERDYGLNFKLYIITQNMTSIFAEELSVFKKAWKFFDVMDKYEEEYMPEGPPMSPLSRSYFTYWQFFDYRFGLARETIGTIFYDLIKPSKTDERIIKAVAALNKSRMGLYQVTKVKGKAITVKELLTEKIQRCAGLSGYEGKPGEVIFARIAPSLLETEELSCILTSPYVILRTSPEDWIEFFSRQGISKEEDGYETKLENLFKYGPAVNYWHEYIMGAYVNFEASHVYLSGIPDIPESLPLSEYMR